MMDRRNRSWTATAGAVAFVGALGVAATDADADTLYKICDAKTYVEASTPDDPQRQKNRGAALKAALESWNSQAVSAAGNSYGDFALALDRKTSCAAAGNGFVCKVAGTPCRQVPKCDAATVQGCQEDTSR